MQLNTTIVFLQPWLAYLWQIKIMAMCNWMWWCHHFIGV